MRFATFETADAAAGAGVVSDAGVHPLPAGVTVLALVRAGLEVAVVVGGNGGSLSPEQAREHIFGYTVMNDWSARDRDPDGFLALDMRALVNGEQVGQDLLSNMGWPFDELISYASRHRGPGRGRGGADRGGDRHGAQPRGGRTHVSAGTRSTGPFRTPKTQAWMRRGRVATVCMNGSSNGV